MKRKLLKSIFVVHRTVSYRRGRSKVSKRNKPSMLPEEEPESEENLDGNDRIMKRIVEVMILVFPLFSSQNAVYIHNPPLQFFLNPFLLLYPLFLYSSVLLLFFSKNESSIDFGFYFYDNLYLFPGTSLEGEVEDFLCFIPQVFTLKRK